MRKLFFWKMSKGKKSYYIKKIDKAVGEQIKERDKHTCQHCETKVSGQNEHVSHVIPRSKGNALRWDKNNLKILCFHCHINWWHKNPTESGEWFRRKFPKRYKYLMENKNRLTKYSAKDLKEMWEAINEKS